MPSKQRYDRSDIRRLNLVCLLNLLRQNGAMSRANIASRLGLTRATVSSIVSDLLDTSFVRETEYTEGGAGRPGMLLELNPNSGSILAVDIDLDNISVLLANTGQESLWRKNATIPANASQDACMQLAELLVQEALSFSKNKNLKCFGICVAWAGVVSWEKGELVYGPTSGWEHIPIKKRWEETYKVPVYVQNEAHSGAIAALNYEKNKDSQNLIYLSLGVGLAAGIIVDGKLLRGEQGFAGQVGHTSFTNNGIKCNCGKKGCWVTEIGASGIKRKLLAQNINLPDSKDEDVDWLNQIETMLIEKDERVVNVLTEVAHQIGEGMGNLAQIFNPSLFIVGGRLADLLRHVEQSITDGMKQNALPDMVKDVRVCVGESDLDRLMGCLGTVLDAVIKDPPLGR